MNHLLTRLLALAELAVDAALKYDYGDPEDRHIWRELQELKPLVAAAMSQPEPEAPTDEELLALTTKPTKSNFFSDWRMATGTRHYCGEVELTIPIGRCDYFTIVADPDTAAKVPDVLRNLLAQPEPEALPAGYIDAEHTGHDREMLEIFYTACRSEGGTADEIHLRGLRAVPQRWGRPAIEPETDHD